MEGRDGRLAGRRFVMVAGTECRLEVRCYGLPVYIGLFNTAISAFMELIREAMV